ncbi:hypothetical protein Scep_026860 [Stephania cephalantha]|uniref:Uncharacterized protein n=1 Tax=Stephania cephalantha TaxID=152367 RepID=A0AAP0EKY0_9MAGN
MEASKGLAESRIDRREATNKRKERRFAPVGGDHQRSRKRAKNAARGDTRRRQSGNAMAAEAANACRQYHIGCSQTYNQLSILHSSFLLLCSLKGETVGISPDRDENLLS